ncbi:MAG: ketol-acid reductoisomerase [Truepera sp.]|nr:ketol-acid reductoisomerase [Truepera sp.]
MARVFRDEDADLSYLDNRTIAILGYGNQGRSQALNLRDSGATVIVGSREDSSAERGRADGFEVVGAVEAVERAQILFLLLPDEVQPEAYTRIESHLNPGDVLVFAHGYNIFHGFITPHEGLDVLLLAPRMIGHGVRTTYLEGQGFPSLIAVDQDASGEALQRVLALAKGIGSTRMGAILSSFEEETVVDLFAEHLAPLYAFRRYITALAAAGYDPWVAMLEFYASGESVETGKAYVEKGLWGQITSHSRTSQYGQEVTGRLTLQQERAEMERLDRMIEYIRSGHFGREWTLEQQAGEPTLHAIRRRNLEHPLQREERTLYELLGRTGTNG